MPGVLHQQLIAILMLLRAIGNGSREIRIRGVVSCTCRVLRPGTHSHMWQISNSGGSSPIWSHDGHTLLYQAGDQLMAVNYAIKGDTFENENPTSGSPSSAAAPQRCRRTASALRGSRQLARPPRQPRSTKSSSWKTSSTNSAAKFAEREAIGRTGNKNAFELRSPPNGASIR